LNFKSLRPVILSTGRGVCEGTYLTFTYYLY
jgi:hypothetical protein